MIILNEDFFDNIDNNEVDIDTDEVKIETQEVKLCLFIDKIYNSLTKDYNIYKFKNRLFYALNDVLNNLDNYKVISEVVELRDYSSMLLHMETKENPDISEQNCLVSDLFENITPQQMRNDKIIIEYGLKIEISLPADFSFFKFDYTITRFIKHIQQDYLKISFDVDFKEPHFIIDDNYSTFIHELYKKLYGNYELTDEVQQQMIQNERNKLKKTGIINKFISELNDINKEDIDIEYADSDANVLFHIKSTSEIFNSIVQTYTKTWMIKCIIKNKLDIINNEKEIRNLILDIFNIALKLKNRYIEDKYTKLLVLIETKNLPTYKISERYNKFFELFCRNTDSPNKVNIKLVSNMKSGARMFINNIYQDANKGMCVALVDKNNNPKSNGFQFYPEEKWLKLYIPEK